MESVYNGGDVMNCIHILGHGRLYKQVLTQNSRDLQQIMANRWLIKLCGETEKER